MNKEKACNNFTATLANVLQVRPLFKHATFNKQFYLVHGLDVATSKYITLLVSSSYLDSARLLEDSAALLTVYPPWKKMFLAEYKTDVYFCTSLIELAAASCTDSAFEMSAKRKNLFDLRCSTSDYSQVLFDSVRFLAELKKCLRSCPNEKRGDCGGFTQDYLFVTQAETGCFEDRAGGGVADSQYMRVNSILDALENIGYYGFVTFVATVQRVGAVQWCQQAIVATQQKQSQNSFQLK